MTFPITSEYICIFQVNADYKMIIRSALSVTGCSQDLVLISDLYRYVPKENIESNARYNLWYLDFASQQMKITIKIPPSKIQIPCMQCQIQNL